MIQINFPARILFVALLLTYAGVAVCAVSVVTPTSDRYAQMTACVSDAHGPAAANAAEHVQDLLNARGAELNESDAGGATTARQFFFTLSDTDAVALRMPYEQKFGTAARQAMETVMARPNYSPADLYTVARRFPLSVTAGVCLHRAADRAAAQGDFISAASLRKLAVEHGATVSTKLPPASAPSPLGGASGSPFGLAGVLPFNATWFDLPSKFEVDKSIPVGANDTAYLADEKGAIAMRSDGTVAWRWQPVVNNAPRGPRFLPGQTGRGTTTIPALFCDAGGEPQVVVVRSAFSKTTSGFLTALRARDGAELWSSAADPIFTSVDFLSSPTIAGRYVLAVALQSADDGSTGSLQLLALEVTTGKLLWRSPLATTDLNLQVRDLDLYRDQSPPAVAGDSVFVAPNVGTVFSVGLFDGELHWTRSYTRADLGDGPVRKFIDLRNKGRDLIAPLAWADLLRWHTSPLCGDDTVLVAPQDSPAMLGLGQKDGKLMWTKNDLPQATPVAIVDGQLVLSGSAVTSVDCRTGNVRWTFAPAAKDRLVGPAVFRDGQILVRSTTGLVEIDPSNGQPKPSESKADFAPTAASDAGKAALASIHLKDAFGTPEAPPKR